MLGRRAFLGPCGLAKRSLKFESAQSRGLSTTLRAHRGHDGDGKCAYYYQSRSMHAHVDQDGDGKPDINMFNCFTVDAAAALEVTKLSQGAFGANIHPRDMLMLDLGRTKARRRRQFTILPRQDCVLINFGTIKAVLQKNKQVIIIEPEAGGKSVVAWAKNLAQKIPYLPSCVSSGMEDARFELGVIEHVLNECTDLFDRRLRLIDPLVRNLLHDDTDEDIDGDFAGLQKLGPLQDTLSVYELELREARECLKNLLAEDEDMLALVIENVSEASSMRSSDVLERDQDIPVDSHSQSHSHTQRHTQAQSQSQSMSALKARRAEAAVEFMLENYILKLSRQIDTIQYYQNKLTMWVSTTDLSMTMRRNKILKYNLHMGIATVSIASSSLVAGILGMNVPNGLEENTHMFAYSIFGMLGLSMLFQGGLSRFLLGRQINQHFLQQATRIQGMKTILIEKADTLDEGLRSVFDVIDNGGHNRLTKGEFVQLLVEREKKEKQFGSTMTQLEQESLKRFTHDVEVLYSLLDTNKDGYLDVEEMKNKFGEYQ